MGSVLNSEAVVGAQGRKPSRMRASRAGGQARSGTGVWPRL